MQRIDFVTILPLIVLGLSLVLTMMMIPFKRSHRLTLVLTLCGLFISLAFLPVSYFTGTPHVTELLTLDGYALFFMGLFFLSAVAVALLTYGYMKGRKSAKEEFYILLLIATLGSSIIVSSSHFASFFLGVELLSVSLYVMIAYLRSIHFHFEAAIKYLILTATSLSFMLFGVAMIYAEMGTMNFYHISHMISFAGPLRLMLLIGSVLFFIGVGFKLAVVPFHLWTPDVYQGAPAPVSVFIATSSKGAVLAFLLRYLTIVNIGNLGPFFPVLAIVAIASMITGNTLALLQTNLKRLLAYSSISHMGYALVAVLASGEAAVFTVTFYLVSYFITMLAAFGVIVVLSEKEGDLDDLSDYRGLVFRHFWLAALLTAALLSLAGIPLTSGFLGKFFLVAAGVGSRLWLLVITLIVTSAIGLFYYLRVIMLLYSQPSAHEAPEAAHPRFAPSFSLVAGVALAVLAFLVIIIGIFPVPVIRLIQVLAMFLE